MSDRPTVPLGRWRPTAREFAAVTTLLLALFALQTAARLRVEPVVAAGESLVGYRLVATGVYSGLVLATLAVVAAGYVAYASVRPPERPEIARVGLGVAILVVLGTYVAVGRRAAPLSVSAVAIPGVYYLGMAALALAYSRVRGLALRTTAPTPASLRWIGVAALGVVGVVVALTVVAAVATDRPLFVAWGRYYLREVGVVTFLQSAVVPAVFAAVGTAVLFNGVVQELLRTRGTAAGAAGAVTALAFLFDWVLAYLLSNVGGAQAVGLVVAAIAVLVALTLAYRSVWGRVDATAGWTHGPVAAAALAVVAVLALDVWLRTFPIVSTPLAFPAIVYAVTLGIAAVVYEHTESVWGPMVPLATYGVAVELAAYWAYLAT